MSWTVLCGLVLALGIALLAAVARRAELARMARRVRERETAVRHGTAEAQLRHPVVDLSRCLGCGTCVAACPENGVLELVHGQAVVVNGARCVGHATCERECPVGAITVTLTKLDRRRDVPVLTEQLEAVGSPGLFLAGEVTAHALIKPAIEQGTAVAAEVARRIAEEGSGASGRDPVRASERGSAGLDLCIVGAGPAGLACALEAKRLGLRFVAIDQEPAAGGTVAKYPRRKLVLTQPVDLPLHGRLERTSYTKEELVELWQGVAREHDLPLRSGEAFQGLEKRGDGYVVRTDRGEHVARHVCLALGRRGTPTKLGVEGEELPKVAYGLLDARSYAGRRILVVGGGDSAVEAAMGLAEQDGNQVTLSYRRDSFFRIRARNEERLERCLATGRLRILFQSEVRAIRPHEVELVLRGEGDAPLVLPNDDVFVMAGGVAPIALLERSGVSFDPALRPAAAEIGEQGTGLAKALAAAFALASLALGWALWHADYYLLPPEARPADPKHSLLRPGRGLGLAFGIAATALIAVNLLYLVRRSPRLSAGLATRLGSLRAWMTSHVATGILALAFATLHAAMAPRDSIGGHALGALALLALTGAIGRYFYAWLPRAANGRELEVAEVKLRLARMGDEWDRGQRGFVERVQAELASLIESRQWKSSLLGRVAGVIGARRELRRVLSGLADVGLSQGIPRERIEETLHLARRAHAHATAAAHYEDLRALLESWRYLHKWVALLMVVLVAVHVAFALAYGSFEISLGGPR
jgi:thioredoxin reductase/Pyruvate/2-oxoacid:ferredoxin oxidoreductase delta subunit